MDGGRDEDEEDEEDGDAGDIENPVSDGGYRPLTGGMVVGLGLRVRHQFVVFIGIIIFDIGDLVVRRARKPYWCWHFCGNWFKVTLSDKLEILVEILPK